MSSGRRFRFQDALLILLALLLIAAFCLLGTWQLHRLAWKLDLIDRVERQLEKPPVLAPDRQAWSAIDGNDAYLPVKVTGHFLHDRETFVQAMTTHGSGYWVLTPLQSERGFVVLVNRGFVDAAHRSPETRQESMPQSRVEISGLLRMSEPDGRLLQRNDPTTDRWYSRDIAAIGAARGLARRDLAPYFIDAYRDQHPGDWPVGGLTVVRFRNTHLGYALTWFGLALMTAGCAWVALRHRHAGLARSAETPH